MTTQAQQHEDRIRVRATTSQGYFEIMEIAIGELLVERQLIGAGEYEGRSRCSFTDAGAGRETVGATAGGLSMADIPKLSVEKALDKLRKSDRPKSTNERHDEQMSALDEEIKRMRAQRLRLERDQRKRD
jgi:hypothetical protein